MPPKEPVAIPINGVLDLHAFAPQDVALLVADYLLEAARAGIHEVRVIHGKGKGVQRVLVRRILADHPQVERFVDAPPEAGGWGATLVWLKARAAPGKLRPRVPQE
ncbi:MAG: Smr/MutS family protein [Pseudomonadota bacterium]